ncbi:MAG: class I SAM-dependent methyltransferase [Gemmataceae bacterium]|nr:class I SAM-dependent methyltransferase [Gemmataceae bacterium]MDW8264251.1 class I SAM-dependent methyltransferase [Gemmataceae bacterium]
MTAPTRRAREQAFHDGQAERRWRTLAAEPARLAGSAEEYLDHESWIRPAFAQLGDVAGRRVLDLGCGHGLAAIVLARRQAHVTALDLSRGYLREARARAAAHAVPIDLVQADAERLPFADASFDAVWGHAILHHLRVDAAANEVRRVLRPGGVAVFCEPWGGNPLLGWARRWLPYAHKERTPDEQPLRPADLQVLRGLFPRLECRGFQLMSMLRRLELPDAWVAALDRFDHRLLEAWPRLAQWCRYVVLTLYR